MPDITPDLTFSRFLKFWRKVHSVSQEELAHRVDSSPRHISRLESGSSRPSEAIIEEIAKALALRDRDRNHLRISAGYFPQQAKVDFHSPELKWLRKAMLLTLKAMDPYPATLMDSGSNILMVNKAWVAIYQKMIPIDKLNMVNNHFDFLFSSVAGEITSGWEDTLSMILMALKQSALLSNDPVEIALLARFIKHPNVPDNWELRASKLEPMASFRIEIKLGDTLKQFFNVSQTIGASGATAYVSEPHLTMNTLYPEDGELDLSPLIDQDLAHPLLFY